MDPRGRPSRSTAVVVETEPKDVAADLAAALGPRAVAVMAKEHGGALHIFAVRMEAAAPKATFRVDGLRAGTAVAVAGEDRSIRAADGSFTDEFGPHAVHIYRIERRGG